MAETEKPGTISRETRLPLELVLGIIAAVIGGTVWATTVNYRLTYVEQGVARLEKHFGTYPNNRNPSEQSAGWSILEKAHGSVSDLPDSDSSPVRNGRVPRGLQTRHERPASLRRIHAEPR